MKKNVAAQAIGAQMIAIADGTAFTGAVTAYVCVDAGAQNIGSQASGACIHEGNGYHTYVPSQAETNGSLIAFTFIGSGAAPQTIQVFTDYPQTGDAFTRVLAKTTDITGFTDLTATQVKAQADQALTDYDGATGADLNSASFDIQATEVSLWGLANTKLDTLTTYVDTEVAAIKAKTDNLPTGIQKNATLSNFPFFMVDSADHVTGKTGLTITATRSIDGGGFAACANSASEVSGGNYKIDLAAADLNGTVIMLRFTGTGADVTEIPIKTNL